MSEIYTNDFFQQLLRYKLGEAPPAPLESEVDNAHRVVLTDLAHRDAWSYVECQSFFLSLRHLIELRKLQEKYQVANFYCNWCAHIAISQSAFGYKLLEQINDFFLQFKSVDHAKTDADYQQEFTAIFSIDNLRKEIKEILALYEIDDVPFVCADDNQANFANMLFNYLAYKAISFGDNYTDGKSKAFKYFDKIEKKYQAADLDRLLITIRLTIMKMDDRLIVEMVRLSNFTIVLGGYLIHQPKPTGTDDQPK